MTSVVRGTKVRFSISGGIEITKQDAFPSWLYLAMSYSNKSKISSDFLEYGELSSET